MSVDSSAPNHLVRCTVGNSEPVEFLIDSGSDWNIISTIFWQALNKARKEGRVVLYDLREKPSDTAKAFASPNPLRVLRSFHAWLSAADLVKPRNFAKLYLVEGGDKCIMGRETALRMGLLLLGADVVQPSIMQVEGEPLHEFPSIPNFILDFDVDPEVKPSVRAYVNIPEAFRERAIGRLKKMELQGIVEKVRTAPRWVSGLSAVPKGERLSPRC